MSTDVPDGVTYREVAEILRTFRDSDWRSISLDLHGMRITVGKDGPPAAAGPGNGAATAPAPVLATAAPPATTSGRGSGGSGSGGSGSGGRGTAAPAPSASPAAPSPATVPSVVAVDTTGCVAVRSPAIGAFWVAPSPGQAPFVEIGQSVAQDEQLAIVEVMKLMNPVTAAVPGEVVAVCADNAEMVEYDQVLFWIRPTDG